ncbi:hypothetical protein evm_009570 [Chilo suppressalis]|nr:hypothetical protein evm_009570 [Chilo suppressalis]
MESCVKWTLCVVLLLTDVVTVNSQFRYDYTYEPKVGGWLKLHVMPSTFFDAFRICNAEGAVLASPLNIYFKNAMMALHKKIIVNSCTLYTGIHSSVAKGSFASIEGKPLSKISVEWAPNEPDNFNDSESCIAMFENGKMADVRCTETFPFICYKKKTVNMAINECGTIDNDYFLESRTGSCYKFHRVGRTWRNAYMTCMAEGGHLAIVNSKTELEVIKEIFARYPPDTRMAQSKEGVSIGIHTWGEDRVFYTVHGQRLVEAGYANFTSGQPDNNRAFDSSGSHCGGIWREELDDFWCTGNTISFICEKRPESLLSEDEYP